jgi:hypothetical protein
VACGDILNGDASGRCCDMTSSVKNQRLVGRCGSLSLDPLLLQRLRDLLGLGGRVRLGSLGTLHGQLLGCVEVRDIVLE